MTITSFIIEVSRWSEAAPRGTDRPKSRCLNALVTTRRNAVTWRSGTLVVAVQQNTTHRNNNTRNGNHKSGHKQHVVRGGDEDNASTILAKLPKCIPPINLSPPPLHSLVAERVHWQKGATLMDNCCSCYFVHHNELCCVVSQWFSNVSGQGPLNWHKLDQEPQLDWRL